MKHLIFRNVIGETTGPGGIPKLEVSLDDLGVVNPNKQFAYIQGDLQGFDKLVVDYEFLMPQQFDNIDVIRTYGQVIEGGNVNFIRGVKLIASFDIAIEKGDLGSVCFPKWNELLKDIYVKAITANPGAGGLRGKSRHVVEMPQPTVMDCFSGEIYTGVWKMNNSEDGLGELDNNDVISHNESQMATHVVCTPQTSEPSEEKGEEIDAPGGEKGEDFS